MSGKDLFEKMTDIDDELITPKTKKLKKAVYLRWFIPIAACFALIMAVFPFVQNNISNQIKKPDEQETSTIGGNNSIQIANPFVDCENVEEAVKIAGFEISLPKNIPNWHDDISIRAIKSNMIEVTYTGSDNELKLRKGTGSEDISGEFKQFDNVNEITIKDIAITLKGNNNLFYVAIWVDGEYTYSVTIKNGFSEKEMIKIISDIK